MEMRDVPSLRDRLADALSGHTADYLEIRVEETDATTLTYRGRSLEEAGRTSNLGGCVRACVKGGWGFVSFNSLEGLRAKVDLAVRQARLVGRETTTLAPVEPHVDFIIPTLVRDPLTVSLEDKKRLMDEYVEAGVDMPVLVPVEGALEAVLALAG